MEEKQPVVIKGRTIHRERTRRRVAPSTRSSSVVRNSRMRRNSVDEIQQTVKIVRKIIISVAVILIVMLFNSIKLPFTQNIVEYVRTAITTDFNFDETIGQLKFVGNYLPDIAAVFGPRQEPVNDELIFSAPARGSVIAMYDEYVAVGGGIQNKGIDIAVDRNAVFYAAADGEVAEVVEHDIYGPSVWISHGDGLFSFYGGYEGLDVKEGQKIKRGDKLGRVGVLSTDQSVLHFEIWENDEPVDPLTYLKPGNEATEI